MSNIIELYLREAALPVSEAPIRALAVTAVLAFAAMLLIWRVVRNVQAGAAKVAAVLWALVRVLVSVAVDITVEGCRLIAGLFALAWAELRSL